MGGIGVWTEHSSKISTVHGVPDCKLLGPSWLGLVSQPADGLTLAAGHCNRKLVGGVCCTMRIELQTAAELSD